MVLLCSLLYADRWRHCWKNPTKVLRTRMQRKAFAQVRGGLPPNAYTSYGIFLRKEKSISTSSQNRKYTFLFQISQFFHFFPIEFRFQTSNMVEFPLPSPLPEGEGTLKSEPQVERYSAKLAGSSNASPRYPSSFGGVLPTLGTLCRAHTPDSL
jgi:hypothetical protein